MIFLGNIIDNNKASGEWKNQLTTKISFILSKDSDGKRLMHSKSDNMEIVTGKNTDEIINEVISSLLRRYQISFEESMKVT